MLSRMRLPATLLTVLLTFGGGAAAAALIAEKDVLDLLADLPVAFMIEGVETGEQGRVFRLRSAEPTAQTSSGALYLRATLTLSSSGDAETAAAAVERLLAAADPDLGLSYAWDYVAASAGSIAHLHAACTFSEESFEKAARAVARKLAGTAAGPAASFWCRCGAGCRAGAPFSSAPAEAVRLPPVQRSDGIEEGDYDNRLDPSGAWTSSTGELSLTHYANRLAFSYLAVFGPTAHICEGAGVAGLVGTDRYEYADERGTVAFVITETELRMDLAEGVASFCGAGWAGDRFTTDDFEPPVVCTVAAEHTHFHVVDSLDRERTPASVGQGNLVETAPARHTGDENWVLGRFVGPWITTLGLLTRGDLECPVAAAAESRY